jgi:hypothetical protein
MPTPFARSTMMAVQLTFGRRSDSDSLLPAPPGRPITPPSANRVMSWMVPDPFQAGRLAFRALPPWEILRVTGLRMAFPSVLG